MTEKYGAGENWNAMWVLISSAPHLLQMPVWITQGFYSVLYDGKWEINCLSYGII